MNIDAVFPDMTSNLLVTGCHFGLRPPGWSFPKHHHHLFELLACCEGSAVLLVNGTSVPLRSGDWLFMKAGVRHQTDNPGEEHFAFFNIHFDIDDPEARKLLSTADYLHFPRSVAEQSRLPQYMEEIGGIMQAGLLETAHPTAPGTQTVPLSFGQKISLQAYILLMIREIAHLHKSGTIQAGEAKGSSIYETDLAHAIEEQLQRLVTTDGSVAQIAQHLNMSRSQCTKIFTKVYGISPHQYLCRLKLNKAKYLLVTTNRTNEQIAAELGFHSASHFSRQFRNWTGVSPNQFRPRMNGTAATGPAVIRRTAPENIAPGD
jgi:AraC-like DNA-binding protein